MDRFYFKTSIKYFEETRKFYKTKFESTDDFLAILDENDEPYDIPNYFIDTHEKALEFLLHMMEKHWFYSDRRYILGYISQVLGRLEK